MTTAPPIPSSSAPSPPLYDVLIIGAGLSGLSAAHYLHSHSVTNLLVLEARDRVGGRTRTQTVDGFPLDTGGAYVGPTQNRVLRLLHSLGIPTKPVYHTGKAVTWTTGGRFSHAGLIPPLSPFTLLDLNHAMQTSDRQHRQVSLTAPWETAVIDGLHLDAMTMEEWINRTCDTDEARELYRVSPSPAASARKPGMR